MTAAILCALLGWHDPYTCADMPLDNETDMGIMCYEADGDMDDSNIDYDDELRQQPLLPAADFDHT